MVVALGPGRFYGSSLPRPRFYNDVKLNDARVDPPPPVMDPFLSWANDAHWSMGGLCLVRHRLQGRIEGSIKKLRSEQERADRKHRTHQTPSPAKTRFAGQKPANLSSLDSDSSNGDEEEEVGQPKRGAVSTSQPEKKRATRLRGELGGVAAAAAAAEPKKAEVEVVVTRKRSRKLVEELAEEIESSEEEVAGVAPLHKKRKKAIAASQRRTSPRKKQS